jgi:thiosulfate/3-mercaptopyruvate sulfurtransferase
MMKVYRSKAILSSSSIFKHKAFFRLHNLIKSDFALTLHKKGPSNTIFIDARSKEAYLNGHVENAVNIHEFFTYLAESSEEGLNKLVNTFKGLLEQKGVTGEEDIVFYEDNLGSLKGVSCRGYYLLKLFGYSDKKVHILEDGFDSWKKTYPKLVQVGEEIVTKKGTFNPKLHEDMHARYTDLKKILDEKKNTVLLDVRDIEEWTGISSSPYGPDFTPRKGRIVGAKHILWTDFMTEDKTQFKSDEDIEALCKKVGISNKNDDIIVYCFKGCRSSNSLVALKKAGYKNVKNYLGSWNEWSRNMDLPIDSTRI